MKVFAAILALALLALQYRLWLSDDGVNEVRRLQMAVVAQQRENAELEARNAQLAAEVENLKEGLDAVEERARSDLGMVRANETFYQVVTPASRDRTLDSTEPDAAEGESTDPESPERATRGSQQASAR
ncbi:MAG TPA: cell division protein FtsB [Steroidobacteraceae bacterium]|nr:cell division protein FtsB [Steroidobacteraceae bacterium]